MAKEKAEAADQTVVRLGNRNAIAIVTDPDDETVKTRVKFDGPKKNYTELIPGESEPGVPLTVMQAVNQIIDPVNGIWQAHSDDDAPAWVAAAGPLGDRIARIIGDHYGIEVREYDPTHGQEG